MKNTLLLLLLPGMFSTAIAQNLVRIGYQDSTLAVDLGVGLWAWPLPMDYDGDGDLDLVVNCPDKPYRGIYFFENPGGDPESVVFLPGKKIAEGARNLQVSHKGGQIRVLGPATEYREFIRHGLAQPLPIEVPTDFKALHERTRANQWKYLDYDGDGDQDLVIGIGEWTQYGWDDAYDERGVWTHGPLLGHVYWAENTGTDLRPTYQEAQPVLTSAQVRQVYGMPSPSFADYDHDGDLDLICGEFLDGFTYFENTGSRTQPEYAMGIPLTYQGERLHMDLQMITPVAVDWNGDGHMDLVVGDEDGRVAWLKHSGRVSDGIPQFFPPVYFKQVAQDLKFGALATPVSVDWDEDGDEDLVCGNTAGYIAWIENRGGSPFPRWAPPRYIHADGQKIRLMAGPNGSIQGPAEAKWGYTTLSAADWNHDGKKDLIVNSIWGKVIWYENVGIAGHPLFTAPRPIRVAWKDKAPKPAWNWWDPQEDELVTQWRTTPFAIDWTGDGLTDLIMLDQEGYLALFERKARQGRLELLPPQHIFLDAGTGSPLRLNEKTAGGSGRRKFTWMDWDRDGRPDLMVNSKSVTFYRNMPGAEQGQILLQFMGEVDERELAGHTTSPTAVDWDQNGLPDLLIGAEDGRFYFLKNPHE